MCGKLSAVLVVLLQCGFGWGQRQWVLPTTTAAEMRNPYTWYWPYAIAGAEAYRDYFKNAQQISNQLYQQAQATQAFSWATGQAGQVAGQAGQTAGQAGQTANGMVNPGQGGQGGQGWNGQGGQGGQNWNGQGGQGGQNWNGQGGQGGQNWNGQNF